MEDITIEFSRHATGRLRLYGIREEDVVATIREISPRGPLESGKAAVLNEQLAEKYGYPLKVVFSREGDRILVITAYPVKRGRRQ